MAPSILQFDARRARSYIFRLPLCTRLLLSSTVAFYIASLFLPWFSAWAALIPQEVGLSTMYRLNTFPIIHLGFFHVLLNILALTPLLERFECEHGSLVTLILFTGPFGTLPGGIYIFIERILFRGNTSISGASIWVFLLLSIEAIKTYRANPHFAIGPYSIPTWTTPLIANLFIAFLIPNTSFLGHLCGAAIGYLWGLGYIKFLAPPEKILRWIEGKLNLLGRLPHYVSVDQKTYGRYGVLPSTSSPRTAPTLGSEDGIPMTYTASTQRLGP
ncbi:putative rhomboid protease [Zalaria obscura]|uniref:Rhomboid protease n=1 Tax=Zalaria obscura TaxID=2024903 RepID=A0ACC3SPQ2_9PEZI